MKRALMRAPLGPTATLALASAALELEAMLDREAIANELAARAPGVAERGRR